MCVPWLCEVTTRYNMENHAVLNVLYRLEHPAMKYHSNCFRIFSPLTFSYYLFVLHLFCFLSQSLTKQLSLALNSLHSPGWPLIPSDPPASTSYRLVLQHPALGTFEQYKNHLLLTQYITPYSVQEQILQQNCLALIQPDWSGFLEFIKQSVGNHTSVYP